MAKYRKKQYHVDSGQYSRKRNEEGKAEGIRKVAVEVGRNNLCPCSSGKKYKNCCLPKGFYFVNKQKKFKAPLWVVLKIKFRRFFTKR